jgi:hypothetical protein
MKNKVKTAIRSRKDLRKAKRQEKKQRKSSYSKQGESESLI